jgi:hypothetical protein
VKHALLFDLDDTLVVEEPAAAASFAATAQVAGTRHRVDTEALAVTARVRERELWYATAAHPVLHACRDQFVGGLVVSLRGEEPDV